MISQETLDAILDSMLQENSVYQSAWGQEVLQRLRENPVTSLTEDERNYFSGLQAWLHDLVTSDLCQTAIDLAILYSQGEVGKAMAKWLRTPPRGEDTFTIVISNLLMLTKPGLAAVTNIFLKSSITRLKFFSNSPIDLNDFNEEQFQTILALIAKPNLSSLALDRLVLTWPEDRIISLTEIIGQLRCLKHLGLADCSFENNGIELLCTLISTPGLESIDIGGSWLDELEPASWQDFWTAAAQLKSIDIKDRGLAYMDDEQWGSFCGGIKNCNLESVDINLAHEKDFEFKTEKLKVLLLALAHSKLIKIAVVLPHSFSSDEWKITIDALKNNFTIQELDYEEPFLGQKIPNTDTYHSQLNKILKRNEYIYQAKQLLDEIDAFLQKNTKDDKLVSVIVDLIQKLENTLEFFEKDTALNSDQNRLQLLQLLESLRLKLSVVQAIVVKTSAPAEILFFKGNNKRGRDDQNRTDLPKAPRPNTITASID